MFYLHVQEHMLLNVRRCNGGTEGAFPLLLVNFPATDVPLWKTQCWPRWTLRSSRNFLMSWCCLCWNVGATSPTGLWVEGGRYLSAVHDAHRRSWAWPSESSPCFCFFLSTEGKASVLLSSVLDGRLPLLKSNNLLLARTNTLSQNYWTALDSTCFPAVQNQFRTQSFQACSWQTGSWSKCVQKHPWPNGNPGGVMWQSDTLCWIDTFWDQMEGGKDGFNFAMLPALKDKCCVPH